jgi:hypothetical protein
MKKFETIVTHDINEVTRRLSYLSNEYIMAQVEGICVDHVGRFNAILSYVVKNKGNAAVAESEEAL